MLYYNCKREREFPSRKGEKKMEDLTKIICGLVNVEIADKLYSKVEGNRNWAIKVETLRTGRKIATCNRYGVLKRRGYLSAFLWEIAEYHIRWYYFTYKKDYEEIKKILENNGYTITY